MTEADLTRRIHDNLNWSRIVLADSPFIDEVPRSDVWTQLMLLWNEPDDKFIEGLYLVLLARPADLKGLTTFRDALAHGLSRTALVRSIANSKEARIGNLDVSWLGKLDTTPGIRRRLFSLATAKTLVRRIMRKMSKLGARLAPPRVASLPASLGVKKSGKGEL